MKKGASSRLGGSHSAAVEDYLKAVHEISKRSQNGLASTGNIARDLWLNPGTVSLMVQRLADAGLLNHQPHYGCWLTQKGLDIANRVLKRHFAIEQFLTNVLGMDAVQSHAEAENLEHAASDCLIVEIERYLTSAKRAA